MSINREWHEHHRNAEEPDVQRAVGLAYRPRQKLRLGMSDHPGQRQIWYGPKSKDEKRRRNHTPLTTYYNEQGKG